MGTFKPLLTLDDRSILQKVIETIRPSVDSIIVVTGHQREQIEPVAHSLGAVCVHNLDFATGGMISSIQAGLMSIRDCNGVLLALVDQPLIQPSTVHQLIEEWRRSRPTMLIPTYREKRGHPVLIDRRGMDDILSLNANQTLKTFRDRLASELLEIEVDDPGITMDLDTPADYERAQSYTRSFRPAHVRSG